ncbi:transglycosylase family protein [Streptomyces sp. ISL-66]|uniref:transglycosylase family protein n=1 Tax=Streptomyces sp. ISL-66 TaxID=2819186 RepID=UPI0027E3E717|nr:transglycosylase family protein [Streptomyces sp. ISL-66]
MPALVVTAGVAGSALALPLFAATGASAAETTTWDKVAECESGGTWSANFGSGSYGGLQFTQEQWKSAGGLDFAPRADLASRSQQIAVAERVLASQGPAAWPQCGASVGLSQQAPAAVVDPGAPRESRPAPPSVSRPDSVVPYLGPATPSTDFGAPTPAAPAPSDMPSFMLPDFPLPVMPSPGLSTGPTSPADPTAPTTPTVPSTDPTAPTTPTTPLPPVDPTAPAVPSTPADPAAPTTPADPTAPTSPTSPTSPASPASPDSPTSPAAPSALGATTDPAGTSADAVEGGGKHRGPAAVEATVTSDAASDPGYTVKRGDTLATIADANGVTGGWNALYEANEQVIGVDANLIKPGQNLDLTHE